MRKPLAIDIDRPIALDLCVGLGGWVEGLTAEGWHVIGVDIEDMFAALGEPKPEHFELRIEDICNVRGADYAHVGLIVGSSPCQDFSYRAMPWSRAKALHAPFLGMWLFWQQFRIQREICEAKGEYVPMVVENVRGAQPWVGRAKWNFGSYYLWGDVPALMPGVVNARKVPGFRFDGSGKSFQTASVEGVKSDADRGGCFGAGNAHGHGRRHAHKSPARKAASAKIAKIPEALSRHIARVYLPARTPA